MPNNMTKEDWALIDSLEPNDIDKMSDEELVATSKVMAKFFGGDGTQTLWELVDIVKSKERA